MTADIYCSIPWRCDCRDPINRCEAGWHKTTYWVCDDGYSCDDYSDGNHEDCDEEDIPSVEEQAQAWREYAEDCARTGRDPLGEYIHAKHKVSREAEWQALFQLSIVGVVLLGVRRRGRGPWLHPCNAPYEVRSYLDVGFKTARGKVDAQIGRRHCVFRCTRGEQPLPTMARLRKLVEDDPEVSVQRTTNCLQIKFKFRCTETRDRSRKAYAKDVKREARKAISA